MSKSGAGPLRDRKKEACRAEIYQTAINLFLTKGYDQTTVEEIAEAANVSKATFFNYFPRKEEIIHYYREEMIDGVLAGWQELLTQKDLKPLQKLKAMVTVLAEQYENRREAARLLLWRQLRMYEGEQFPFGNFLQLISIMGQVVAEGQQAGEIRSDVKTMLVVENLLGIFFIQITKWVSSDYTGHLRDQLVPSFNLFFDGVKAGK